MSAVIVIPVRDEAPTLDAVVREARRHAPVIVVDDGSRDGSAEIARSAGAEVVRHARGMGKGAALASGLALARRRGVDLAVTLDGDGQHAPADVPALLAAARRVPGAIVVGSRAHGVAAMPRERAHALLVADFFVSWALGVPMHDTQSGFRVYPLDRYESVKPRRGGFVWETEILLRAVAQGMAVVEVPVRVIPRAGRRSRFRPLVDGGAIGAYLAAPVLRRWAGETAAAVGEVTGVFRGERRRARHAELSAALGAVSITLWGPTMTRVWGAMATECVGAWWRHPRRAGAAAAAAATLASLPVLGVLAAQSLVAGRGPDLAGPLVRRLYDVARLDRRRAGAPEAAGGAVPAAVTVAR